MLWKAVRDEGVRAYFKIVDSGGILATGLGSGDFNALLIAPDDSANQALAVSESTQQAGVYYVDVPSAFLGTHGAGMYGLSLGVHSTSPSIDDEVLYPLDVTVHDLDRIASFVGALEGTADAGTLSSVTLPAGASAIDDYYRGFVCLVLSGTAAGQARVISAYDGSSRVATVRPDWKSAPDATSEFVLCPFGPSLTASMEADAIPAEAVSAGARDKVADGTWDRADKVEPGFTPVQALRLVGAVILGRSSGDPGFPRFLSLDGAVERYRSEVDSDGNRTLVVMSP